MSLELAHVAHPPNVVADAIGLFIIPGQFSAADFFTQIDCLEHRTVAVSAPADVVNLSRARRADEFGQTLPPGRSCGCCREPVCPYIRKRGRAGRSP